MSDNNYSNYVRNALRTEAPYDAAAGRLILNPENLRLLHAVLGLTTEIGELTDPLKKHIFYGAPLDKVNLREETGDLFWYLALVMAYLDEPNFTAILKTNIEKLRARFPEAFTEDKANNRDLPAERAVLEGPPPGEGKIVDTLIYGNSTP